MKKTIDFRKRMREIRFITEHCLTPEQFQKRMDDKVQRAIDLQRAIKRQRECSIDSSR